MKRLTLCFCLLTLTLVSSGLAAQENIITFPQERMRLITAFDLIEEQGGYAVAYNEELININRKVAPPQG